MSFTCRVVVDTGLGEVVGLSVRLCQAIGEVVLAIVRLCWLWNRRSCVRQSVRFVVLAGSRSTDCVRWLVRAHPTAGLTLLLLCFDAPRFFSPSPRGLDRDLQPVAVREVLCCLGWWFHNNNSPDTCIFIGGNPAALTRCHGTTPQTTHEPAKPHTWPHKTNAHSAVPATITAPRGSPSVLPRAARLGRRSRVGHHRQAERLSHLLRDRDRSAPPPRGAAS